MNNDEILFSIITVCYNSESTIRRTIESVVKQTYSYREYIIVDGASSDKTLDIIREYRKKYSWIKYISEPDQGIYDAMNKGIALTEGEFVGIINADDWYEIDALMTVNDYICKSQEDVDIVCGRINIWRDEKTKSVSTIRSTNMLWEGMVFSHPAIFVRRELYMKYGGYDKNFKIAADYKFFFERYLDGERFCVIDKVIADFCYGGISTTENYLTACETNSVVLSYLNMCENPERIKEICNRRLRSGFLWDEILLHPDEVGAELRSMLCAGKDLVVFGTGFWSELINRIVDDTDRIICYVDNDRSKWGKKYYNKYIHNPQRLVNGSYNVIIASFDYEAEIRNQIIGLNNESINLITLNDVIECLLE